MEIGIRDKVEPRCELQKNVEAIDLYIQPEIAAETYHRILVVVIVVIVAHTDISARAVVKIEFRAGVERLEPKPVYVDKEKIAVVVVEIPGEQDVEPHGLGTPEMQVQPRRVAHLEADADVASLFLGKGFIGR